MGADGCIEMNEAYIDNEVLLLAKHFIELQNQV